MTAHAPKIKSVVAAFLLSLPLCPGGPALAQAGSEKSDGLLERLAEAEDAVTAGRIEREIRLEWSKSGSAAMDLLLKRGRDALEVNEVGRAIDHLTALTDHAPAFAEGWHALALAYYTDERFGPAVYALERTLALNPNHFGALRGLGAVFDQLEKPALAFDAYSRAAALRPHDEDIDAALERLNRAARGMSL
ncbi:hypothetical protein [Litorisediminicola beolgyonensis]|uniref:Tetratricopeptide repeat protein n=1 Tax=Litorisediminicola beolgyonensis TaxID=1173614 RepID=A0ABW3ZK89_9RHOB